MTAYNVLGLGQPLIDRVIRVDEASMKELGFTDIGGSQQLTEEQLQALLDKIAEIQKKRAYAVSPSTASPYTLFKTTTVPGGSCANTIKGLAGLGEKCAFVGKIGKDEMGQLYKNRMSQRGVIPLMTETNVARTGEVVCLITPDGQRTMRAFLGGSVDMSENDLLPHDFKGIKLFVVEGYCIYNLPLMLRAMEYAKANGAIISYDLGSFELCRKFKDLLVNKILKNYVDIVFANEIEAKELCKGSPEQAVDFLASICHVAVVMMGEKGCWVKSQNCKYKCPTKPVTATDTTGAGDCFASGFLYAYMQGYTLEQCARLGSLCGREVVQVIGAELLQTTWQNLKLAVNNEFMMVGSKQSQSFTGSKMPHAQEQDSLFSKSYEPPKTTMSTSIPIKNKVAPQF